MTAVPRPLLCLVLLFGFAWPGFAQQTGKEIDQRLTAEVLKTMLFAKTIEEQQFCDYVIQRRDAGILPSRLVYAVYEKAVTKDKGRRFAYFKRALEILCHREGIALYPAPVQASSTSSPSGFSAIAAFLKGLFP